jgi:uncharacterized membrane protein
MSALKFGRKRVASVSDAATGKATVEAIIDCHSSRVIELLTNFEDLPRHIFCLHEASVLRQFEGNATVRFTMKLPFPLGTVTWTNLITTRHHEASDSLEWLLLEGDLSECKGSIVLRQIGEGGEQTHASYQIHVEHKNRLPKRAQRMAVQWLLPRVISRLCKRLESNA